MINVLVFKRAGSWQCSLLSTGNGFAIGTLPANDPSLNLKDRFHLPTWIFVDDVEGVNQVIENLVMVELRLRYFWVLNLDPAGFQES